MKSTFSVIYYLKRQVVKKDGTVPVMGRITVDGSQTQFSCKLSVDPKLWDTKGGRVTGRSAAALETNRMLDKMRVRINRHYQEIMERDNFVTAEKVKNAFLGLEHRYHTLMQVFRQHNEDYEKQVEAGMKAKGTLLKYRTVYKHMQEFLDIRYHVKDIALKELTPAFISDFEMFLRTDKHCCTNTIWLYVCPLTGNADCLVLNSVANVEKAAGLLDGYGRIGCFLDRDEAGRRTLAVLTKRYGERVTDRSSLYDGCKDLNEYLQQTTKKQKNNHLKIEEK